MALPMDTVTDGADVAPWLVRLVRRAMRCSAGCRGASVCLRWPGGEAHSASTHPDLAVLAALQEETGEGPGVDAARSLRAVGAADLVADGRWPDFRVAALERGLRACAAVPVLTEGVAATVTLYAFRPWRLTAGGRESVGMLAGETVGGLLREHARTGAETEAEQLRTAMATRAVIDQAIGIVTHLLDCDPGRAFDVLRGLSQRTNRKLSAVAAQIVRARGRGSTRELRRLLTETS
ncbi:ANTAR domain-containing protein [Streptomyces sp. NPDC057249]|uniref:GAF and ANTAR domain-containing protein n=1 Tax=Streptomyces sp. NPDC057249 TaxID=3346067 RepID=UPI00362C2FBF